MKIYHNPRCRKSREAVERDSIKFMQEFNTIPTLGNFLFAIDSFKKFINFLLVKFALTTKT